MNQYYKVKDGMPISEVEVLLRNLEHIDIGWRWCKDELPDADGGYVVKLEAGRIGWAVWNGEKWIGFNSPVVQWCRLPEPLKEDK